MTNGDQGRLDQPTIGGLPQSGGSGFLAKAKNLLATTPFVIAVIAMVAIAATTVSGNGVATDFASKTLPGSAILLFLLPCLIMSGMMLAMMVKKKD